jgi:hypothetical protein
LIGTEFFHGQGFGNQLFCYVTSRCVALDNSCEFATVGQDLFGAPRWNQKGPYFLNIELGKNVNRSDFPNFYEEKSQRYFFPTCDHDRTIGCDISLADPSLADVADGTLITGNLQAENYFLHHKSEIKEWLRLKPEYDSMEYYADNLCILNFRGGEYVGAKELYLKRDYWTNAINWMKKINSRMEFVVITDDIDAASTMLPEIMVKHFDLDKDYATIKNAKYLILSNSSFAFFPAFTSETVEYIIAPKFWGRHNVSDGYWATGQNIYTGWNYLDKGGGLYTSEECRTEFEQYRKSNQMYEISNKPIKQNIIVRGLNNSSRFFKRVVGYFLRTIHKKPSNRK